ncbi:NAC domain-containing protein 30-like [Mercurialis annua]|uniref:NAC domain-containing protein 30-like n=1 Tax=Mercurialis annua TaxID=3986 RepID=UPI002160E08D|nr:NAC domain-containing protein 30-like [Mercurialis annua]XP_050222144.1 NAC domain-containing protein 30-like [Mercurialis annua]
MLPGFRFNPTDQELVGFYLLHINNQKDSAFDIDHQFPVPFCDFYGGEEPWQIWNRFGGEQKNNLERLFFHTKLKKKATRGTGTNIDRKFGSGGGGWHGATSGDKSPIHVSDLVGYKKSFSYWNKSRPDQDRCWIMTEYSVEGRGWEFVICELKPGRKQPKKRNHEAAVLESEAKRCRIEQHNGDQAVATETNEKGCRIEQEYNQEYPNYGGGLTEEFVAEEANYYDEGTVTLQDNQEGTYSENGEDALEWERLDELLNSEPLPPSNFAEKNTEMNGEVKEGGEENLDGFFEGLEDLNFSGKFLELMDFELPLYDAN